MNDTSRQWLQIAKNQLKETTTAHIKQRMTSIENIVNKRLRSNSKHFAIDDRLKQEICNKARNIIEEYPGTKKLMNNLEKSEQDVIKKTRTWWNRIKSRPLGSILFAPICIFAVYNFIDENCKSLSSVEQLILFIDIFDGFMCNLIKFPKTKPIALIPHQCFSADGIFKDNCSQFIQIFGDQNIQWNAYIERISVNIKDAFQQCLLQIKTKFMNVSQNDMFPIVSIKTWNYNMNNMNNSDTYTVTNYGRQSAEQMQYMDGNVGKQIWNNNINNCESNSSESIVNTSNTVERECTEQMGYGGGNVGQDTMETFNAFGEEKNDINNIKLSATCTITVGYGPIHEPYKNQFYHAFHPYYRDEINPSYVDTTNSKDQCIQYDCCNMRNECASPFIDNNYYQYTDFEQDMDVFDKYFYQYTNSN